GPGGLRLTPSTASRDSDESPLGGRRIRPLAGRGDLAGGGDARLSPPARGLLRVAGRTPSGRSARCRRDPVSDPSDGHAGRRQRRRGAVAAVTASVAVREPDDAPVAATSAAE